jgi:superfamily I DNA/RNA helicase
MKKIHHTNAWAGCGKTTTLIKDFINLIDEGTHIDDIAFISFTKNTVEGVRSRLISRGIPEKTINDRVRTFHSMAYNMVENHGEIITKYEDCLKAAIPFSHSNLIYKEYWDTYNRDRQGLRAEGYTGQMDWFVKAYEKWKKDNSMIDFTDMLYEVYKQKYILTFKVLFVDEIQDCTPLMFAILRQWVDEQPGSLIRSAGDIDQAIYGFGGSSPFGLLDFIDSFPEDDKIVDKLNKTYRLRKNVYNFAEAYARKNARRIQQSLETDKEGGRILFLSVPAIASGLKKSLNEGKRCTVLARDHYTLKLIKESFKANRIPIALPIATQRAFAIVEGGLDQRLTIEKMRALNSTIFPVSLFYRGAKAEFGKMSKEYEMEDILNNHAELGLNKGNGMFSLAGYTMLKDKDISVLDVPEPDKQYYRHMVKEYGVWIILLNFTQCMNLREMRQILS